MKHVKTNYIGQKIPAADVSKMNPLHMPLCYYLGFLLIISLLRLGPFLTSLLRAAVPSYHF